MSTVSTDLTFVPKVWQDHVGAYFRSKLVYGAFAFTPDKEKILKEAKTGDTINFPFYGKIGEAEEPGENDSLVVDKLTDSSFSATVFEVGKALGFTDKTYVVSGDGELGLTDEAVRQMGRVHAEKLDAKLLTEMHTSYEVGYNAADANGLMNVRSLFKAKVTAFGDRQDEALVCFMHSKQAYDLMADSTSGFMKADANDPLYGQAGFLGRILGMAVITADSTVHTVDGVAAGVDSYDAMICKADAYGYMSKQDIQFERDRDILARKDLMTCTEWYAVKNFNAKYSVDDKRIARVRTAASF